MSVTYETRREFGRSDTGTLNHDNHADVCNLRSNIECIRYVWYSNSGDVDCDGWDMMNSISKDEFPNDVPLKLVIDG